MDVSGQLYVSAALTLGKRLDDLEKRKISFPCLEFNSGS
jgi:hypothetical protein